MKAADGAYISARGLCESCATENMLVAAAAMRAMHAAHAAAEASKAAREQLAAAVRGEP